jgi:hypothetical protein
MFLDGLHKRRWRLLVRVCFARGWGEMLDDQRKEGESPGATLRSRDKIEYRECDSTSLLAKITVSMHA